jgi:hypothetical protein
MRAKKSLWTVCLLGLFASTLLVSAMLNAKESNTQGEVFTGTLQGIGGTLGHLTVPFTLEISGTTSDEDATKYLDILKTKKQDGLFRAVEKNKLGYFRFITTSVQIPNIAKFTYDLNVVRVKKTEKGREITVLFERNPSWYELRQGTRSLDYPFTYIELFVDNNGNGDGSLIGAAKIRWNKKDQLEIENFAVYPAKIMGLMKR